MNIRNRIFTSAGAAALALTLAACAEDPVDNTVTVPEATPVAVIDFDPLVPVYTLTPVQRTARDAYDMSAMETEYAGYRDSTGEPSAMSGGSPSSANNMNATNSPNTGTANSSGDMATGSPANTMSQGMPARSAMDWAYLDRNSDGKLSVAEYALWAIPVDPNEPKRNDQTKPYLNADQANKAADSFFFFDQDGTTYLSQEEFARARRGDGVS